MFQKGNIRSMFPRAEPFKRPVSQVTEFFDTDAEDEGSDIDDSPIDDYEKVRIMCLTWVCGTTNSSSMKQERADLPSQQSTRCRRPIQVGKAHSTCKWK